MSKTKTTSFLFIVLVSSLLAGCSPKQEAATSKPTMEKSAWRKDGNTYIFDASYDNSAGTSEDTFTVTLDEKAVVVAAQASPKGESSKHAEGLARFNVALTPVIVGKNLSELGEFDTLGKYSLTTAAFNDALKQLQDQVGSNS